MHTIGQYRVLASIGGDGIQALFTAHDLRLDRPVTLQVISAKGPLTEELKARFHREGQAWARLDHPNIARIIEVGEHEGQLVLVLEPLDGEELAGLIARRQPVRLEEKLLLMIQVCDALHHAHDHGMVHGHVTPHDIFVLRGGQAKLLDVGLARLTYTEAGLSAPAEILRYMAPEQLGGRVDQCSDIFSAGAVFFELLAGRPAFDRPDPVELLDQLRWDSPPPLTEVDRTIPADVGDTIERMLRKDPDRRFSNLAEARAALVFARRRLTDEVLLATLAEYVTRLRECRLTWRFEAPVGNDPPATATVGTGASKRMRAAPGPTPGMAKRRARFRVHEWRELALAAGLLLALGLSVNHALRRADPPTPLASPPSMPASSAGIGTTAVVRAQMLAARRGAATAGAGRLAARLWASAAEREQEAEIALSQEAFSRAQTSFMDAENTYHEAWRRAAAVVAARRERLAGLRRAAQAAELAAEGARGEAERAGASRYAGAALASARQREIEARAERDRRDYALAARRFQSAQHEYQRAALEARLAESQRVGGVLLANLGRAAFGDLR